MATVSDDAIDYVNSTSTFPAVIFKRTHATRHAVENGKFLANALGSGMTLEGNFTYECTNTSREADKPDDPSACANRMLFMATAGWSMHYFQSFVTPNGNVTVEEWTDAWDDMHAFDEADWTWDEFMPLCTTFYTEMLHPYLEWWSQNDIPLLLRSYERSGEIFYSARFAIPKLGHIIEVVSGNVTGGAWRSRFEPYGACECEAASVLPRSLADYRHASNQYPQPTDGLPALLIAMVAMPAGDVSQFPNFITSVTGLPSEYVAIANASDDGGCEYSDTSMLVSESYMIPVRMVNNRCAKRTPLRTVAIWEEDYTRTLDQNMNKMGYSGYGRYVDWHIGVYSNQRTLDTVGKWLDERSIGYKQGGFNTSFTASPTPAPTGADVGSAFSVAPTPFPSPAGPAPTTLITGTGVPNITGSVWSRGVSGLGVEFQSSYSGEYFDLRKVRVLDYCSPGGTEPYGEQVFDASSTAYYCPTHWAAFADE
jgi:hypothetical protein